jgi:chromate transporter
MRGVNAAVVGVLAAALWDPVWTGSVHGLADALVAGAGVALLLSGRVPALFVVAGSAVAAIVIGG